MFEGESPYPTSIIDFFSAKMKKQIEVISACMNLCILDDEKERFNSMGDMVSFSKQQIAKDTVYSPVDDILLFDKIIRSSCPEAYLGFFFANDAEDIKRFMQNLASNLKVFEKKPWFDTGLSNSQIDSIKLLNNGNWLLNSNELKIHGIWFRSWYNAYADVVILELEEPDPYIIEGKEYSVVACINNQEIIDMDKVNSGYVRINGEPVSVGSLNVEIRSQWSKVLHGNNMHMFIGSKYHSTMQWELSSLRLRLFDKHLEESEITGLWDQFWNIMPNELLRCWF